MLLIFWIWLSQFVCLVGQICGVRAYFQPNSVASAKIRLIRISAENMVQPAEFFEKSGWGVYVCLCVCLSYSGSNFWKFWPRNFIFSVQVCLQNLGWLPAYCNQSRQEIRSEYEGCRMPKSAVVSALAMARRVDLKNLDPLTVGDVTNRPMTVNHRYTV